MISAARTVVVVVILAQHRRGIGGLHPRRLQRLLQLLDVDAVALVAVESLEGCEHFWRGLAQTLGQTVRLRLCLLGCFDRHLARVWSGSPVQHTVSVREQKEYDARLAAPGQARQGR